MTIEELSQKEVDLILKDVEDAPLRALMQNLCKKSFVKGALFGIGRGGKEANEKIAKLEDEIWELKRELRIHC